MDGCAGWLAESSARVRGATDRFDQPFSHPHSKSPPQHHSIPPRDVERVFCYLFTTSEGDVQESVMGKGSKAAASAAASGRGSVPLSGLGAYVLCHVVNEPHTS